MKKIMERFPRYVYNNNVEKEYELYTQTKVGENFRSWYAAPFVGYRDYLCVSKDDSGLTAEVIADTGRELTPGECK